jgi:glutaredoxin-like protein DUF836
MASHPLTSVPSRLRGARSKQKGARLYLRDGCDLCLEALELVRPLQRSGRLILTVVDIATDRDLLMGYGLTIPVLEIDGGPRLEWPFSRSDVHRALA